MIYGIFIAINMLIAILNNRERIHKIKIGDPTQVNHGFWFAIYCLFCAPVWFMPHAGPLLCVAVFLQHGYIFPMFYNLIALGWNDVFHLSTTTRATYDKSIVDVIKWLNRVFHADLPFSMFVPDLVIFITSIFLLWIY